MPFGHAAQGEYGTYFIGYARSPQTIEQMLTNMFVGRPPGNYDRLLDVSRAVTGSLFFVPSMPLLESLADGAADSGASAGADQGGTDQASADEDGAGQDSPPDDHAAEPAPPDSAGSLGIGSLRGVTQHG